MKAVTSVTFGGVPATQFTQPAADGTIMATPPPQSAGLDPKVEVVVTGDKGTVKLPFTYTQ
jgi:hypothetical protein